MVRRWLCDWCHKWSSSNAYLIQAYDPQKPKKHKTANFQLLFICKRCKDNLITC